MDFYELIDRVNAVDVNKETSMTDIIDNIDINDDNFKFWVDNIFSDKVDAFDMNKLPYLIDELYKSNDKIKFMLGCMLIESTCYTINFITNLEEYPLFEEKFELLKNTLITVYENVDNGISNCMALIMLNNDPEFKLFDDKDKERLVKATTRKLTDILNYLRNEKIDSIVFEDLEVIVDLVCYLNSKEINDIVDEIDRLDITSAADLFIIKYRIINDMDILVEKLDRLKNNLVTLIKLYGIMEDLNVNNVYLEDIKQETLAMSDMVRWLSYPTELGSIPDGIELLGDIVLNNERYYVFKFYKQNFSIKGDLIGISGGYPLDHVSAKASGYTFSKFEQLNDWKLQSVELVEFIGRYWKERRENE